MNPSPPSTPDTELRVLADPTAPSLARRALRSALEDAVHPQVMVDVLIVVSELVANSVLHAGQSPDDAITLRMWRGPLFASRWRTTAGVWRTSPPRVGADGV